MSLGPTFAVLKVGVLEILARLHLIDQKVSDEAALEVLERYGPLDEDLFAGGVETGFLHVDDLGAYLRAYMHHPDEPDVNIYGLPIGISPGVDD